MPANQLQTRFILINPSHAGNVGAAARAIKVMGFEQLVLVAPRWANVLRREETIQRASGALDVLASAKIVDSLDDALGGITHLCATAMTPRDFGPPTRTPRAHFESDEIGTLLNVEQTIDYSREQRTNLVEKSPLDSDLGALEGHAGATAPSAGIGFLFGSERFGMKNEDVYRCHVCLQIPTNPSFGSLNLAAALQVIAYEWRLALGGFDAPGAGAVHGETPADARQVAGLLGHWEQSLAQIGFLDPMAPKKLMPRLNQLFNRAGVTQEEVHILRGIAKMMVRPQINTNASTDTKP